MSDHVPLYLTLNLGSNPDECWLDVVPKAFLFIIHGVSIKFAFIGVQTDIKSGNGKDNI